MFQAGNDINTSSNRKSAAFRGALDVSERVSEFEEFRMHEYACTRASYYTTPAEFLCRFAVNIECHSSK